MIYYTLLNARAISSAWPAPPPNSAWSIEQ